MICFVSGQQDSRGKPQIVYRVDHQDIITSMSRSWDCLASEHGAMRLPRDELIGQPIWTFIEDNSTQTIYEELMATLRLSCGSVSFPYCCTSAKVRHRMEMTATANDAGEIEFRAEIVHTESVLFTPEMRRRFGGQPLAIRCNLCTQIRFGSTWGDIVTAVQNGLLDSDLPAMIAFGVCEECCGEVFDRRSRESWQLGNPRHPKLPPRESKRDAKA